MEVDERGSIDGPERKTGATALADGGGVARQQKRGRVGMIAESIDQLELMDVWYEDDLDDAG